MRQKITLREVGLRDGLQIHPTFMQTRDKLDWIVSQALPDMAMQGSLARAGLPHGYVPAAARLAA